MRSTFVSVVVLLTVTGVVFGVPTMTAEWLGPIGGGLRAEVPIYSNMVLTPPNYPVSGSNPAAYIAVDDYVSTAPAGGASPLTSMSFAGGVSAVGGILYFQFLDVSQNVVTGFGIQFPAAGNAVWNFPLGGAISVPNAGYLAVAPADGTTGTWYENVQSPTVGSTESTYPGHTEPGGAVLNLKFALNVPEPSALVPLALGLVAIIRRR